MSELAEVTDQVQTQAPGLLTPGPCHCPAPAVPGTPCRFPLAQLLDWPTEGRGLHVSEEAVLVLLQCRTQASGPERRSPGLRVWGGLGEAWLTVMPPPVLHPALLSATQVGSSVAQLCSVLSNPPFVFHFRNFVNTFIQFKKPIIVAVNGPAIGLGASILPLCDVVWANEKAWFQTPYTTFGQSPDGCSTVMFPKIMGGASANEMLLSGRKLTAQEACGKGLVSQVFWPGTFTQEVMVRIKELASCNPVVLEESKALVRCSMKPELEQANERECEVLRKIWGSAQGMDSMLKYLQRKIDEF
uniref:Chromodomain Y like n=1 Tax=Sus scrofa TaxID=9823 RepID=A0A8D1NFR4_PIG